MWKRADTCMAKSRRRFRTISCATIGFVLASATLQSAFAQQIYDTPDAAAKDLIESARTQAQRFGVRILGAQGANLLRTGDPEDDAERLKEFNEAAATGFTVIQKTPELRVLQVGERGWTFPFPIVKVKTGWRFDATKGKEEIRNRLIGFNELSAIGACRAYVAAQNEYHAADHDGDGVRAYANRIRSTPGQRDGLFWEPEDQSDVSPLSDFMTTARAKGAQPSAGEYNGYRFRLLRSQGAAAPGGAYSYFVNGRMLHGHALVAWPVTWGETGIQTFLCGTDGRVYQKNLGPKASGVSEYNPDRTWTRVD